MSSTRLNTILPDEIIQALSFIDQSKKEFDMEPVAATGVSYPIHAKRTLARFLRESKAKGNVGHVWATYKVLCKEIKISRCTVKRWLTRYI
jgi:hypothetical protein